VVTGVYQLTVTTCPAGTLIYVIGNIIIMSSISSSEVDGVEAFEGLHVLKAAAHFQTKLKLVKFLTDFLTVDKI